MAKISPLLFVAGLLLVAAIASADSTEKPVRAWFKSCSGCRLKRMPELKAFLHKVHADKIYGDAVKVTYVGGANPVLYLYGANDVELSQTPVDNWTEEQLHSHLQNLGFKITETAAEAITTPKKTEM